MQNAARLLCVVFVGLGCAHACLAAQVAVDDYRLKAAFLYQFSQFVEWPSAAWKTARTVQLCVVEPNPFGSELAQLVRGESFNGLPFEVRQVHGSDEVSGCHVLFAGIRSGDASAVLRATAGRPVLTVGESADFLASGGIIALRLVDGRVRFEIQVANAKKAGLRISSQLLSLAQAVRGGPS